MRYSISILVVCFALGLAQRPASAMTALIDFENTPKLSGQPSLFMNAGPEQDIVVPDIATVKGGVVLGDETNLPALSFATAPDVYGTASDNFIPGASTTLQSTLTIDVAPAFNVTEVSFPILNGFTAPVTYTADAFSGMTLVDQQVFDNVPANTGSGFGITDLKGTDITSVTVTPADLTKGWDFSIDSLAFNETVQTAVGGVKPPPAVPLPAAGWAGGVVMAGLVGIGAIKRKLRFA